MSAARIEATGGLHCVSGARYAEILRNSGGEAPTREWVSIDDLALTLIAGGAEGLASLLHDALLMDAEMNGPEEGEAWHELAADARELLARIRGLVAAREIGEALNAFGARGGRMEQP